MAGLCLPRVARAGVELTTLQLSRVDGALMVEFLAQVTLPRAVEDALQRGVPIYFATQAEIATALADPTTDIAKGVNGAANVLTAQICKSTNQQPTAVCTAPGVVAAAAKLQ